MKKMVGIVGEGPTDYLVLKSVIDRITEEENDYVRIQPEQDMAGEYGNGWKGVWNWCETVGCDIDKLMKGLTPNLDVIVIQMDGDVARKEKEIHCKCQHVLCEKKENISPLKCQEIKKNNCPVKIPCGDHIDSPEGYRSHIENCILEWGNFDSERKDIIRVVPCDSTDAWIVAAFDSEPETEKILNPWEAVISRKKEYHGIRVPGHKKNNRIYQQFLPMLEKKWNQVVVFCDSARSLECDVRNDWQE